MNMGQVYIIQKKFDKAINMYIKNNLDYKLPLKLE